MFKKKELTRLGDILVSKGLISPAQLDLAIQEQSRRKRLLDPSDPNAKVAPIGEILIELGFIDQLQLKRGLNWQQRLRHASIAMALCAPFMMFAPSAAASVVRPAPITVEAENYAGMSGVISENTADIGAGKNIGAISANDWMTYSVDVPVTGKYKIVYRLASPNNNAKFVLKSGTDVDLAPAITVPKTGGWQVWKDVEQTVILQKGPQTLKIYAQVGGFNFNWFKVENIDPVPEALSRLIEAESYSSMSGVGQEATSDTGGGKNVGYISPGNWMNYENAELIIPKTGSYKISYRVANQNNDATLLLKNIATGAVLDSVTIPKTGGWQTWATVERVITIPQGLTKLQIYAQAGEFNINWFKVESVSDPVTASSSSSSSSTSSSSSSSSSSAASATVPPTSVFPFVIQAEAYSSMFGVAKETTTDVGGGQALGYVDTGDWVSYSKSVLNVPFSGKYRFSYRVASLKGGASLTLKEIGTNAVLDTVTIPSTGGWQNWQTVEREVELKEGEQTFNLLANTGGVNINWIQIQPVAVPTSLTVQAENYTKMSGVVNETTSDIGGGKNVGYFDTGDWMSYDNAILDVPNAGSYKVTYRLASNKNLVKFELYDLDTGAIIDTVPVPNTAGWQAWIDFERTIKLPVGKKRFGIRSINGSVNLNWFKFEPINNAGNVISDIYIPASSAASSSSIPAAVSSSSSSSPAVVSSSSSSKAVSSSMSSSSAASSQPVAGPVGLSWVPPDKRENGEFLDIADLGGYEIRFKKTTETKYTYISINDAWTNTYNFEWLEGNYVFQIAAFDKNGVYSPFVDIQRQ